MLWLVTKYKSKAPQLKQSQTDPKQNNPLLDYILSTMNSIVVYIDKMKICVVQNQQIDTKITESERKSHHG